MNALLMIHAAAAAAMAAALWFVQLVHYPLLLDLPPGELPGLAARNIRRTASSLGPVMAAELCCALFLVVGPASLRLQAWIGLALLVAGWLSTGLVQFPIHRRLAAGGDPAEVRLLISSNRWRVVLWTARAVLALRMLSEGAS